MGSWRLKGAMDPPFETLTAQIEGMWRHMLKDLKLYPIDKVQMQCRQQTFGLHAQSCNIAKHQHCAGMMCVGQASHTTDLRHCALMSQ